MKKLRALVAVALVALAAAAVIASPEVAAGETLCATCLTVADVEKATGMKGLMRKEGPISLEFYDATGVRILEARFDRPETWDTEVTRNPSLYEAVPGIGQKAAIGIPGMPYRLTLLKGKYCVMIHSVPAGGKVPLTRDQLIAIGKIVAGRL